MKITNEIIDSPKAIEIQENDEENIEEADNEGDDEEG